MSIVTITYDFYNSRNPKCRACEYWKTNEDRRLANSGDCISKHSKVKCKSQRAHNSKACREFVFCKIEDKKVESKTSTTDQKIPCECGCSRLFWFGDFVRCPRCFAELKVTKTNGNPEWWIRRWDKINKRYKKNLEKHNKKFIN